MSFVAGRLASFTIQRCSRSLTAPILQQSLRFASTRYFTKDHEWCQQVASAADVYAVGISSHAQEALGEIVYVELPVVGTDVTAGSECGSLESVKAANDIYAPLTGQIVESNSAVEEKPALINQDCYEKGWLFQVKLSQPDEVKSLMSESDYETFLKESDA